MLDQVAMQGPQGADVALVVRHDDVAADGCSELVEQFDSIDWLWPRLDLFERDSASLQFLASEPQLRALGLHRLFNYCDGYLELFRHREALLAVLEQR